MENNWKPLWANRCADAAILRGGDPEKIFMELKRSSGFDVVKDQLTYQSFVDWYREMKRKLSCRLPNGKAIQSVFEVGCGSGANLYLFEKDGMNCGGIDYFPQMLESARQVLCASDIHCADASELPTGPVYDTLISVSVFGYFDDWEYAGTVLEKMCQKARYSIGLLDIADIEQREAYLNCRRQSIHDYEKRYEGLPRLFFSKEFITDFARAHDMEVEICPVRLQNYWNNQFYFDCYLYKNFVLIGKSGHTRFCD